MASPGSLGVFLCRKVFRGSIRNSGFRNIFTSCCHRCQTTAASHHAGPVPRAYGQPSPSSHPHILQEGQVTPGLTQAEFQNRRFKLMEAIGQHVMKLQCNIYHHLVIIPSATKVYMSENVPYPFRQNTNFLYLTGFQEPNSLLLLCTVPGQSLPEYASTIFVPEKNPKVEIWEGPRTGPDGAVELLGIDAAYNAEEMEDFLQAFSRDCRFMLWYDPNVPLPAAFQDVVQNFILQAKHTGLESPTEFVQQCRLIKSPSEIKLMCQSANIAAESMTEVIKVSHPFINETELHAKMEFECRTRGSERLSYPPVVAGGPRANVIHYMANNQQVLPGEMVLMDAGCELHGYSSDLTRTWPVDGHFSEAQQELYEALLTVQEELIQMCANFPTLDQLFHIMCQITAAKLQKLRLIPETMGKIEACKMAYNFCPHHVGHYLGMDVHDTSLMSRRLKLKPGMVITIEPGLYIRSNSKQIPEKYRGLGMRIEDDVLITDEGPEVLTAKCPKSIRDIEWLFTDKQQ